MAKNINKIIRISIFLLSICNLLFHIEAIVNAATITTVSAPADATYYPGDNLDFTVTFNEPVNTNLPLDRVAGVSAAYGLRKLRSAYEGFAIQARTTSVVYTVNFNEEVSGVDISDFELTTTGTIIGASVTSVSVPSGTAIYYSRHQFSD